MSFLRDCFGEITEQLVSVHEVLPVLHRREQFKRPRQDVSFEFLDPVGGGGHEFLVVGVDRYWCEFS